jgi:crossover junction endodeoxyribonuclease RuvC
MIFAAIDPGAVSAAIAVFDDAAPLLVDDLGTVDGMVDGIALVKLLQDMRIAQVVIERVHSMPKQGVASTFKFGMGVGVIHGVLSALWLPITLVTPAQWKGFHKLDADKEKARALALRKWPEHHDRLQRKKDTNRAEALLIGDWYYVHCVVPRIPELFA